MSDYVRVTVLNSTPVLKQIDPERAALITGLGQLGKIGSNVNQIARELHLKGSPGRVDRFPMRA